MRLRERGGVRPAGVGSVAGTGVVRVWGGGLAGWSKCAGAEEEPLGAGLEAASAALVLPWTSTGGRPLAVVEVEGGGGRLACRVRSLATSVDFRPLCDTPWWRHNRITVVLYAESRSIVRRSGSAAMPEVESSGSDNILCVGLLSDQPAGYVCCCSCSC